MTTSTAATKGNKRFRNGSSVTDCAQRLTSCFPDLLVARLALISYLLRVARWRLDPSHRMPPDWGPFLTSVHDVPVTTKRTTRATDAVYTLGLKGLNVAVSWCSPGSKREVVPAAVPLATTTGGPRRVVPSWNCTVPAANAGLTVAVSVTWVPWATGDVGEVFSEVMVNVGGGIGCDPPMLAI